MNPPTAFIAGWPVAHSRSPLIHRFWLAQHGIDGDYVRAPVAPEGLDAFLATIGAAGYVGGNVTVPHKQAALQSCDEVTATARRLGAVNTVWLDGGRLWGDNTDVHGFAANLDARLPRWRNGAAALVIGAGGASRSVVGALLEAGFADIVVLNRTAERAHAIAADFGSPVRGGALQRLADELGAADLVVNATAAGMGDAAALEIDWRAARPDAIATDIVYVPLRTAFLRGAAARGLAVVDGLGMLLHQAVPGFERWFGVRPVVSDELRRRVAADIGV